VTVAIVDYGAGNLSSVRRSLAAVGAKADIVRQPEAVDDAGAIVIPGVGHFDATASLGDDWRRAIARRLDAGAALLGICLGMHWLFDGSDEAPARAGAGIFNGRCARLSAGDVKVPHVGWNTLTRAVRESRMLADLGAQPSVYFTHAFAAPITPNTVATATHGTTFAAAAERDRVWAVQFHPEKSGAAGLRLLANFVAFAARTR
jgi:glutamine amidotransferase